MRILGNRRWRSGLGCRFRGSRSSNNNQVFVPPPQVLPTCEAAAASAEAQVEEVLMSKEVQAG